MAHGRLAETWAVLCGATSRVNSLRWPQRVRLLRCDDRPVHVCACNSDAFRAGTIALVARRSCRYPIQLHFESWPPAGWVPWRSRLTPFLMLGPRTEHGTRSTGSYRVEYRVQNAECGLECMQTRVCALLLRRTSLYDNNMVVIMHVCLSWLSSTSIVLLPVDRNPTFYIHFQESGCCYSTECP